MEQRIGCASPRRGGAAGIRNKTCSVPIPNQRKLFHTTLVSDTLPSDTLGLILKNLSNTDLINIVATNKALTEPAKK